MSMQQCVAIMIENLRRAGVSQGDINALVGTAPLDRALVKKLGEKLREATAGPNVEIKTCTFLCDGVTFELETTLADCKSFCLLDPDTKWGGDPNTCRRAD